MSRKNTAAPEENLNEPSFEEPSEEDLGDSLGEVDFNVEDEYKPEPLLSALTYHGVVQDVKFKPGISAIVWTIQLQNNGGYMSDGETPVDGASVNFFNWIPKKGDEDLYTASGKQTKRQWKINTLKEFQSTMELDMSTPTKIAEAIANAEWVGLEVEVQVTLEEYQGRARNNARSLKRS